MCKGLDLLKTNRSKFTRGLDPLYGDACSAKSFKVLALIFSTDCSLIDWLQSALKIKSFEKKIFFFSFLKIRRHVWERGNWISMVHGQKLLLKKDF